MEELRGLEEMNQLGLQYICAWMHHRETPCVAIFISNKQTHHIFPFIFNLFSCTKLENMKAEQVLAEGQGVGTSSREEEMGNGGQGMNAVQKCVQCM
jgi:hypothetical protein